VGSWVGERRRLEDLMVAHLVVSGKQDIAPSQLLCLVGEWRVQAALVLGVLGGSHCGCHFA